MVYKLSKYEYLHSILKSKSKVFIETQST